MFEIVENGSHPGSRSACPPRDLRVGVIFCRRTICFRRLRSAKRSEKIVGSSGNVFADLGFVGAGERQTKVCLAVAINEVLQRRGFSQGKAAEMLGINQPKVSALSKYRLEGFSVERLMRLAVRKRPSSARSNPLPDAGRVTDGTRSAVSWKHGYRRLAPHRGSYRR